MRPAFRNLAIAGAGIAALAAPPAARPAAAQGLDSLTIAGMPWRQIGPANMMGRVTDIEGIPSPSKTFYVAAAGGGIWKTTNNGTTFRPIFDHEKCISMGDMAIAPSDTNVLYVGTGEEDSRNSISPGCGVFKSTDGGKTWTDVGLEKTEAIGRIVVHPTDPNTAYVAALGAIWRSNPERGLYKTTDGGATWKLVKFVSDKAGFVDVILDPRDPNTVWATSWERVRGPYFLNSGGPGSALWKSTDAGATWTEIKGNGLPTSTKGRIMIDISDSNPDYIYLMVEADTLPNTTRADTAQRRPSGLYRSTDGGKTWEKRADTNVRPFYYSQVRVDPKDPERVYWSSTPVNFSTDGGKTVRNATQGLHVDHHAMWIDPVDPQRFVVGNDGGIGITFDKGGNYLFPANFAIGQFYNISYDMAVPYRVCGGLQDNGSWCGPSRRRDGDITNVAWFNVSGGDGFVTQQDPTDPNIVYSESQGGNIQRTNLVTGEGERLVKPSWRVRYQQFEDSIIIERGDTTKAATAAQKQRIADWRKLQLSDSLAFELRWNWNTPYLISPHNSHVLYAGSNRVLKSTKMGDDFYPISPDLTTKDSVKIHVSTETTGGITPDATGAETYSTIVSLNESPVRPGLLYVGTDDGNVWLTRNDGATWENLTGRFPGVPKNTYVSRIEPSSHDSSTIYVTFDNHRNGDFTPYVYVSNDYGKTFRSIANDLPKGGINFVHVIREDPVNRDLLFVGTDIGAYVSIDRGAHWQEFMTNLPRVPVHDLKIHPREHELIAGTHGRSIWIADIAPLQQMTPTVIAEGTYFFKPKTAFEYNESPTAGPMGGGGGWGHGNFEVSGGQYGAEITYRVAGSAAADGDNGRAAQAKIVITDVVGDTLQSLNGPARPGIHRVYWNFMGKRPPAEPLGPSGKRDSAQVMNRMNFVFDSLKKAGRNEQMLENTRMQLLSGDLGGFFRRGGGGGGGSGFQARPGESNPPAPPREAGARRDTTARRAAGGAGGAGAQAGAPDMDFLRELAGLLSPGGGGGGFRGIGRITEALAGNRGPAQLVETGDYLVTITVGDKTMKQLLRVERIGNAQAIPVAELLGEEDEEPVRR
jgi:photosystem II stability/assembly factor-like uncharacterized protein